MRQRSESPSRYALKIIAISSFLKNFAAMSLSNSLRTSPLYRSSAIQIRIGTIKPSFFRYATSAGSTFAAASRNATLFCSSFTLYSEGILEAISKIRRSVSGIRISRPAAVLILSTLR